MIAPGLHGDSVVRESESEHEEGDDLRGVGLGRGHSDLRSCIDVDSAVRLPADRRADCVRDANCQGAVRLAVPAEYSLLRFARSSRFEHIRQRNPSVIYMAFAKSCFCESVVWAILFRICHGVISKFPFISDLKRFQIEVQFISIFSFLLPT